MQGKEPGQEVLWTSSNVVNSQFPNVATATVKVGCRGLFLSLHCCPMTPRNPHHQQVGSVDSNFDGLADVINMVASVQAPWPVYGVKALGQLNYSFSVGGSLGHGRTNTS